MVAKLVGKILSCCGDNEFLSSKLPWKKQNGTDEDHDVADSKPSKMSNNNNSGNKKSGKFTDKDMKHENCKWSSLPAKIRKAAQEIGLDETKWNDNEIEETVFDKHWWDLETKEVEVMEMLGWDEASWEHKYEESSWSDLPDHVQKAATAAGFDEDTWNEDEWPENLHKSWGDLSEKDRNAMMVLGWHEGKWS